LDVADTNDESRQEQNKITNQFLDCVFEVDVPENNVEWRLVRGHAVVSLLTMYGAYSLKFDPLNQEDDAKRLFGRIVSAENSLWQATRLNPAGASSLSKEARLLAKDIGRVNRIIAVIQVSTAAFKPAKRRLIGFGQKVAALVATPTPAGAIGALRDFRKAVKRAATIAVKGSAYINGIISWMKNIRDAKGGIPSLDDWKAIDDIYLRPACKSVAFMAYGDFRSCIPNRP
jgi:hypothetical protein